MWSEQAEREIDYFVCDDEASLLYLVNMGTIPLHVWASRTAKIDRPDWCVLDLDPKDAPFSDVIKVAQTMHALCEEIGLPNLVKTSGSSGLHVLIPLGGQCRYDEARSLGFHKMVLAAFPDSQKTGANTGCDIAKSLAMYPFSERGCGGATK